MLKKKSFLTLLLVFCMIVPAMCTLAACGKKDNKDNPKPVVTTVTAEQWSNALNFEGVTNFHWKKAGLISNIDIRANSTSASHVFIDRNSGAINAKTVYNVEEEDGASAIYKYAYNKNFESDITKDLYTRTKEAATPVENLFSLVNPKNSFSQIVNAFDSFDYNSEEKMYVSKTAVTYSGVSSNLKLKFADAKLVWLEDTFATGSYEGQSETTEISYGSVEVEQANLSLVTATQWAKILAFDGVNNFTSRLEGSDRVITTKVTANAVSHSFTRVGGTSIDIYDITNKKHYNMPQGSDKYTVTDENDLTFDSALGNVGSPIRAYSSIKNSFDSFEYKADEKVYYAASVTFDGAPRQDFKLTFNNGHLTKVEYKYTTSMGAEVTTTITYTYGNTTVTIPTGDQLAS